ncbi:MAG: GGDEF domain-containing protein [Rhodospirillales bacterium]|nr:GGDEF domain-containing protein [Rhodospirillales bacterium]
MASDLIQNEHARHAVGPANNRLELTREQAFLDGRHDIFDILARHTVADIAPLIERDAVSGLLNRAGFVRALKREIARTNRGHSVGGLLVMFSLENLDKIRERYGEKAAERAVKLIAQALENEIRDMDLAARTQDDEFILLFTDTTMSQALSRLQNMALRLNRLSLICNDEEIRLSLSLGLKSYKKGAQADAVFEDASADLKRNRHHAAEVRRA